MRALLLVLVVLGLPAAGAQSCRSAPHVELEKGTEIPPLRIGQASEQPFDVLLTCDPAPSTAPTASVTVRVTVPEPPQGFSASLAKETYTVSGVDCPTSGPMRLANTLRLERTGAGEVYERRFDVVAQGSCETFTFSTKETYATWVPIEGAFEVTSLNQSMVRGQNRDGLVHYTFRSTYNTIVQVTTTVDHVDGRLLPAVIPPSQVHIEPGFSQGAEKTVILSFRTGHENGNVNYTSSYRVSFSVRPAQILPAYVHDDSPLFAANGTLVVTTAGHFLPSPGAPFVLAVLTVGLVLGRRLRRDA